MLHYNLELESCQDKGRWNKYEHLTTRNCLFQGMHNCDEAQKEEQQPAAGFHLHVRYFGDVSKDQVTTEKVSEPTSLVRLSLPEGPASPASEVSPCSRKRWT